LIKGKDVFIVDAVRTPVGKYGGSLKDARVDDLAALVIKEITTRNLDKNSIDNWVFKPGRRRQQEFSENELTAGRTSGLSCRCHYKQALRLGHAGNN
jgi:acetyl-CoA acetyltransferase